VVRELDADARVLRVVVTLSAFALAGAIGLATAREVGRLGRREVVDLGTSASGPDRCATCHAAALSAPGDSGPLAHRQHDVPRLGCVTCHGGTGRALVAAAAHARPGSTGVDPLMRGPGLEASCARCHPPGITGAPHLARGATLYVGLGCALCHGGRGDGDAALAGPALRRVGLQEPVEVRRKLDDPGAGSPMPAFRTLLAQSEPDAGDLVLFVRALMLPPLRSTTDALVRAPCTSCHVGARASGRYRHACPFVSAPDLACQRCHAAGVPASPRDCPRIAAERATCAVCHGEGP
jgi:mono/diheme cytochrome c family protein